MKVKFSSKLSGEQRERFFAHLDSLPEEQRPVFAFLGRRSGLWHQLGGGTAQMLVLIYEDRVVISKRGMANAKKEKGRSTKPLSEVDDVHVITGPLFSSVQFRFRDGSKTKIANVNHGAARQMEEFATNRVAAFDRSRLDEGALHDFWFACVSGLPLPEELVF